MTWIQTYTGVAFDLRKVTAANIVKEDIAHSLGMQCRYTGHVKFFYSVAEHCCLVHDWLLEQHDSPKLALAGLLHDAGEAYTGDMSSPLKHIGCGSEVWDNLVRDIDRTIEWKFRLTGSIKLHDRRVTEADRRILHDEKAELLGPPPRDWGLKLWAPLGVKLHGWDPAQAKAEYLERLLR